MLKIYKDGDTFFLTTDIKNSTGFLEELAIVVEEISEKYSDDIHFQMDCILPLCYDILLMFDGYKPKKKGPYLTIGEMTPHSKLIYETNE